MTDSGPRLLEKLRDAGVDVWLEQERIRYRAPKGQLSEELAGEVKVHRAELLAILQSLGKNQPDSSTSRPAAPRETAGESVVAAFQPTAPTRRTKTKFSLFNDERLIDDVPQPDESCHPYLRYVSPYKGFLFSQLDMEKRYVRGQGCLLYDEHGKEYLDFIAQFGALPFGFNPPEIWQALDEVRDAQTPSFVNPSLMDSAGALAKRLIEIAPAGMRYVAFANSGAEAVEVAFKICRAATKRFGILATTNGFHGLTLGSMSATGNRVYHQGFGAPAAGFDHIPYGDLPALRDILAARPGYYAALIVEPIQGEGGIVEAPPGYLAEALNLCRAAGTLFILDEVQTGLGRTGELFACQHDGVVPDLMTLAKALGGGLLPIGACLYGAAAYTAEFDLRHSSTFAGNTLACQAGLASLTRLARDDWSLIRDVAAHGAYLKQRLSELQQKYPELIRSIRGRGYLLGVELRLDELLQETNLLGFLQQQNFVIHLLVGYLLNVEGIRIAPSFSSGTVIRIEPPLIAGRSECDRFLNAFDRALDTLRQRDSAKLTSFLAGGDGERGVAPHDQPSIGPTAEPVEFTPPMTTIPTRRDDGRFAFIVHLLSPRDLAELDASLATLSNERLMTLKQRMIRFLDPFPVGSFEVVSAIGRRAVGELILIPHTAEELLQLPGDQALDEIRLAVEIARDRGAKVVGLGGFTSVVTQGGLGLTGAALPQLTSGNSFTVVAARHAVREASRSRDLDLAKSTVAVVGATGMIGRALSALLAEEVGRLHLMGNPMYPKHSLSRLQDVAAYVSQHVSRLAESGVQFSPSSVAGRLMARRNGTEWLSSEFPLSSDVAIGMTTDVASALADADIVITATNSPDPFIESGHLKPSAIICDVSRPFNVCADVAAQRPDVLLIEGGLVRVPGNPDFRFLGGKERGIIVACVAETILLALEHQPEFDGLCGTLEISTILELQRIGQKHGFEVTCGDGACAHSV